MEEAKVSFYGFRNPPLFAQFAQLSKELYFPPLLSYIPDQGQSPPLMERELRIPTVHIGLLCQKPASVPRLKESPSTSNIDEPKIESHLNSESMCKCPYCGKQFETDKAMFGHMRIHRDRGFKGFKKPLVLKRRSESRPDPDSDIDRLLSNSWGKTKKHGSKQALDKNSPAAVAAFTLIKISCSDGSYQNKERTVEFDPLDEKKYVCERCNRSFPSHQALVVHRSGHEKEREIVATRKPTELKIGDMQESAKRKVKSGSHVCEICGVSYPTGQQLGGHKRAHYKKDPSMISEVPDGQDALNSF